MRLTMKPSFFPLIVILLGALQIAAGPRLGTSFFIPGPYQLKNGDISLCGEGLFNLRMHGADLALGIHHIFRTSPESDVIIDGDLVYDFQSQIEVRKKSSIFTYDEIHRNARGRGIVYHLTKTATVSRGKIILEVQQIGQGAHSYSCEWQHSNFK